MWGGGAGVIFCCGEGAGVGEETEREGVGLGGGIGGFAVGVGFEREGSDSRFPRMDGVVVGVNDRRSFTGAGGFGAGGCIIFRRSIGGILEGGKLGGNGRGTEEGGAGCWGRGGGAGVGGDKTIGDCFIGAAEGVEKEDAGVEGIGKVVFCEEGANDRRSSAGTTDLTSGGLTDGIGGEGGFIGSEVSSFSMGFFVSWGSVNEDVARSGAFLAGDI